MEHVCVDDIHENVMLYEFDPSLFISLTTSNTLATIPRKPSILTTNDSWLRYFSPCPIQINSQKHI